MIEWSGMTCDEKKEHIFELKLSQECVKPTLNKDLFPFNFSPFLRTKLTLRNDVIVT